MIIAAFSAVYFIWGSTYLVNYWAIASIPPFLMSGSRFLVAGMLLYTWGLLRKEPPSTVRQWGNSFLIGNLFLTIGTGAVVWALQWIDTGLAALIVAADPLLIMMLLWVLLNKKPQWQGIVGAFIGMIGTAVLVGQPQLSDTPGARWGLVAIAVALLAWGLASIYVSRIDLPESRLRRSALQMLGGGIGLCLFSVAIGEPATFHWADLTARSAFSWIYLVLFGSLVAFSSFNFLLAKVSPEKVATSTYVNPIVALLLGWWLNGEQVSGQSLLAGAILLTGVFFISSSKGQAHG